MRLADLIPFALASPASTDLCINGKSVFVDRGEGMQPLPSAEVDPCESKAWLLEVLSRCGKSWDARAPFVDASFVHENFKLRLHAVFPPVSEAGLLISIRKLRSPEVSQTPEERWRLSPREFHLLSEAARRGDSIILSGATGSGKTTLASDLLSKVPANERMIALEDTPELAPLHSHFLSLQSRPPNADGHGELTLRTLLKQALRMRPDRIILGECRGAEVLDLLQALNTGHKGGLATLHANSPREAIKRLETLSLLSGIPGVSIPVIREWIASGVQWVAQVERSPTGRLIKAISQICGLEAGTVVMRSHQ
jgi:pilus assembly protein CpaF